MRAVVCVPGGVEVAEVADPVARPGEVVVAVEACGLCGSDVHAIEHGMTVDGQILGHEFAGRVVEAGSDVDAGLVGRAVAVNPVGSCGSCRACARGVPFQCPAVPNVGITAPGAYAQYVAVPQGQLVRLPDHLPVELGAHAEPLAVALHAVDLARVGPGDCVLVYGVGPIGLNAVIALRLAGVDAVVAAGRSPGRRAAAAAVGADVVVDTREVSIVDYAKQHGTRFTAVLECSAAPGAAMEALEVLAPGGTFVEVGLATDVAPVPLPRLVGEGLTLTGSCAFDAPTYQRAVDHIVAGRAPVAALISERVGLDATPEALVRLRTPGELVRLLTRPWD
ncbi:MAG: alcohol dehydrogenase catalytic domain-containing protein [Micromonosporaceae bacterium]|nr:alcohol dehydrogenase catalytic domain-containing protein [Micromonosporaceae bacterium]